MIMEFIMKMIGFILTPVLQILDFAGLDITAATNAATSILSYLESGWQMLNIFCPTLDACLGLALVCISVEGIYKLYLFIMWVLKKIPMLGVS